MLTIEDCIDRYAIELHSKDDFAEFDRLRKEQGYDNSQNIWKGSYIEDEVSTYGFAYIRPERALNGSVIFYHGTMRESYRTNGATGVDISQLLPDVSLLDILET